MPQRQKQIRLLYQRSMNLQMIFGHPLFNCDKKSQSNHLTLLLYEQFHLTDENDNCCLTR